MRRDLLAQEASNGSAVISSEIVLNIGWFLVCAGRVIVADGDLAVSEVEDAALARMPAVRRAVAVQLDVLDAAKRAGIPPAVRGPREESGANPGRALA
jgi:hypothetical protein